MLKNQASYKTQIQKSYFSDTQTFVLLQTKEEQEEEIVASPAPQVQIDWIIKELSGEYCIISNPEFLINASSKKLIRIYSQFLDMRYKFSTMGSDNLITLADDANLLVDAATYELQRYNEGDVSSILNYFRGVELSEIMGDSHATDLSSVFNCSDTDLAEAYSQLNEVYSVKLAMELYSHLTGDSLNPYLTDSELLTKVHNTIKAFREESFDNFSEMLFQDYGIKLTKPKMVKHAFSLITSESELEATVEIEKDINPVTESEIAPTTNVELVENENENGNNTNESMTVEVIEQKPIKPKFEIKTKRNKNKNQNECGNQSEFQQENYGDNVIDFLAYKTQKDLNKNRNKGGGKSLRVQKPLQERLECENEKRNFQKPFSFLERSQFKWKFENKRLKRLISLPKLAMTVNTNLILFGKESLATGIDQRQKVIEGVPTLLSGNG